MDSSIGRTKRSTYRWSSAARDLIAAHLNARGPKLRQLVTQLVEITGHPRPACLRFARRMGIQAKGRYRKWPKPDQERLLEILDKHSVSYAAQKMKCSKASIYALLRRLNLSPSSRRDCFSVRSLAGLLHIRKEEINSWIKKEWLKATTIQVGKVSRTMIKPKDFCLFCEEYRDRVVGNRLNVERMDFVYNYVYPPDHNRLLGVRQSKKERLAAEESPEDDGLLPAESAESDSNVCPAP